MKILVVDDEINTRAAAEQLTLLGHKVEVADDPGDFLKELSYESKRKGLGRLVDRFNHRSKINYDVILFEYLEGTITVVPVLLGELKDPVNVIIDGRKPIPKNNLKKIVISNGYIFGGRTIKNWPIILERALEAAGQKITKAVSSNLVSKILKANSA